MSVHTGDTTRQAVDAIVDAANSALKRGGGVDGAIHAAAGPHLQAELDGIGGCPTGECRLSHGHRLPAPWIIHAVGPVWRGGTTNDDALLDELGVLPQRSMSGVLSRCSKAVSGPPLFAMEASRAGHRLA